MLVNVNNDYRPPTLAQLSLPCSLTLAVLLLALLPNSFEMLEWSRIGINNGEWWRLISGHLLHSNSVHLWMNVGGLWLLFALHQPHYRKSIWLVSTVTMLLVSLAMWQWVSSTSQYVGLSALLHGLFTWGALQDINHARRSGWLLLLGVILKVGWENIFGGSDSTAALIDARVAVESHLLGVGAAILCFFVAMLIRKITT